MIYSGHTGICQTTPKRFFQKTLMECEGANEGETKTRGMVILDDFRLDSYLEDNRIGIADLLEWRNRFPNTVLYTVMDRLYAAIMNPDFDNDQIFDEFKRIIGEINEKDLNQISYLMANVPVRGVMKDAWIRRDGKVLSQRQFWIETFAGETVVLYIPIDFDKETIEQLHSYAFSQEHHGDIWRKSKVDMLGVGEIIAPMSLEKAITIGVLRAEKKEEIEMLPTVYSEEWNPIRKLKRFFDRSVKVNAPYDVYKGGESIAFRYTVPIPFRKLNGSRLTILGATANKEHMESVLDISIEREPIKKVKWPKSNRCFQYNTARFPRKKPFDHRSEFGWPTSLYPIKRERTVCD